MIRLPADDRLIIATFSALVVGSYDVTVEAAGFKQAKFAAVPVSVGAVVTLDARLEVGAVQFSATGMNRTAVR